DGGRAHLGEIDRPERRTIGEGHGDADLALAAGRKLEIPRERAGGAAERVLDLGTRRQLTVDQVAQSASLLEGRRAETGRAGERHDTQATVHHDAAVAPGERAHGGGSTESLERLPRGRHLEGSQRDVEPHAPGGGAVVLDAVAGAGGRTVGVRGGERRGGEDEI